MGLTQRRVEEARYESERVILHGLWRLSRGKDLSMPFRDIRNSRKAFKAALQLLGMRNIPSWWKRVKAEAEKGMFLEALEHIEWIRDEARIWEHDSEPGQSLPTIARIPLRFFGLNEQEVNALEQRLRLKRLLFEIELLHIHCGDELCYDQVLHFARLAGVTLEDVGLTHQELINLTRPGAEETVALFLHLPPYGEEITSLQDFNDRLAALEDDTRKRVLTAIRRWHIQVMPLEMVLAEVF